MTSEEWPCVKCHCRESGLEHGGLGLEKKGESSLISGYLQLKFQVGIPLLEWLSAGPSNLVVCSKFIIFSSQNELTLIYFTNFCIYRISLISLLSSGFPSLLVEILLLLAFTQGIM
jgi:hypothetical protein